MWQDAGFLTGKPDTKLTMKQLDHYIEQLPLLFERLTPAEQQALPAPGKWSKQEILGHLIDSAINNLQRFTEVQFLPQPYIVKAYQQNELVLVNHYAALPAEHLVQLWQSLNRQIIFVVENIPAEKLHYPVNPKYASNEMKTLAWIIGDYVAHLAHHWKQLAPET